MRSQTRAKSLWLRLAEAERSFAVRREQDSGATNGAWVFDESLSGITATSVW